MKEFASLSKKEKSELYKKLLSEYEKYRAMDLSLDLSRGKPNSEQLDISQAMLAVDMSKEFCKDDTGFDCRNYGMLDGVPEMKRFFAYLYGLEKEYIFIGGNSSLQLMYDTLARAMLFGVLGSPRPWCKEEGLKWICVVPGYDRHFAITEALGFELISVRMNEDGPDMDEVERLVRDEKVKGIWCVPKYSNPTGNTYSAEVVERLAKMKCAAPDFRIMWDNAYAVHDINDCGDTLVDIFALARKYGNEDRIFYYSSTSKVTFPGGGVSLLAATPKNLEQMKRYIGVQTIGYDKLNQLRHLHYFTNPDAVREHMVKMGKYIKGKFDITLSALSELDGLGIAEWTKPNGGYFVSVNVLPGKAKRVFELMRDAGVTLTKVGATFPYGIDPEDRNLRIAPTYPTDDELRLAIKILTLSIKIASLEE